MFSFFCCLKGVFEFAFFVLLIVYVSLCLFVCAVRACVFVYRLCFCVNAFVPPLSFSVVVFCACVFCAWLCVFGLC